MLRWIFCWKMYINLWAFAIRHIIIINFLINLLGKALQTLILRSSMKILWLPQISSWFLSTLSLLQRFCPRLLSKGSIFPEKVNLPDNMLQGAGTNKSGVQIAKIIIMIMIMMIVPIKTLLMCRMPCLHKWKLIVDT